MPSSPFPTLEPLRDSDVEVQGIQASSWLALVNTLPSLQMSPRKEGNTDLSILEMKEAGGSY